MGRLIDADELLKEIEKAALEVEKKMKDRRTGKTLAQGCLTGLACVREAVKRQPAAYDPDKVVEQLEKLKSLVQVNRVLDDIVNDKPKELGMLIAYEKAIEIVKAGGADEM